MILARKSTTILVYSKIMYWKKLKYIYSFDHQVNISCANSLPDYFVILDLDRLLMALKEPDMNNPRRQPWVYTKLFSALKELNILVNSTILRPFRAEDPRIISPPADAGGYSYIATSWQPLCYSYFFIN